MRILIKMNNKMGNSELRLLGQRISLKRTGGDPELNSEAISLVASRLAEAEKRVKIPKNPQHVALLALLDLAEEYLLAKRRVAAYQVQLGESVEEMSQALGKGAGLPTRSVEGELGLPTQTQEA
jgi:hypothetical protein